MIQEPIKFEPILKEKIWGGTKLFTILDKPKIVNSTTIGESWEISSVKDNISVFATGTYKGFTLTELLIKFTSNLVGKSVYKRFKNEFPLLIKFIDAKKDLSIQLHPNDALALKRHNSFGKTEMWYVLQADENANLIVGFKEKIDVETYQKYLNKNKILDVLNIDVVKKGDVYFIPTGRVHAIGAGVLLAEIQQTSDITYRIYDWNRKDTNGNYRELHTEKALEALDFSVQKEYRESYKKTVNKSENIVSCPFFTTNIIELNGSLSLNYVKRDSFTIFMCVAGNATIIYKNGEQKLKYGETILIPNCLNELTLVSKEKTELLEVYIN